MGKEKLPKRLNQKSAKKLAKSLGGQETRGGKHAVKMVKQGKRPITLPMHGGEDYGPRLSNDILKQLEDWREGSDGN